MTSPAAGHLVVAPWRQSKEVGQHEVMPAIAPPSSPLSAPIDRRRWWWRVLVGGLALWVLTAVVAAFTGDTTLVPTLILIGSFLIPFTVVVFVIERIANGVPVLPVIAAFIIGGICGVLLAAILEHGLTLDLGNSVTVGFIEETVKGAVVVVLGWRLRIRTPSIGILLGSTVGAGFAAFESAGYAFQAALAAPTGSLGPLLHTELLRALLTPFGHVVWTAIIGAGLFVKGTRRTRTWLLIACFVTAVVLHSAWDAVGPLSHDLAKGLASEGDAAATASALYVVGVFVVGAAGWTALRYLASRTSA